MQGCTISPEAKEYQKANQDRKESVGSGKWRVTNLDRCMERMVLQCIDAAEREKFGKE